MKMVFIQPTGNYQLHEYRHNMITLSSHILNKDKIYNVVETTKYKDFNYELLIDGDTANCYNPYHFPLTDGQFEKYFRNPTVDHYQIKMFTTEHDCNKFLNTLKRDYLKDVKFTENQFMVIYLVEGEV